MFDRVVWRLVYCKLLRTVHGPCWCAGQQQGLARAGSGAPMPPKNSKSATTGKGKKRRNSSSFFSSNEIYGPPTSSDDGSVPFHHLPEIVRNRILDSSTGDERSRSVQRELIEGRAARHDAQVHANRAYSERVARATRERREKEADLDICGQGAHRAARTAARAGRAEEVAAKAAQKALKTQRLLTKQSGKQ